MVVTHGFTGKGIICTVYISLNNCICTCVHVQSFTSGSVFDLPMRLKSGNLF